MSVSGELTGYYRPAGAPANRAFVRLRDGTIHTYLVPGSVDTCFFNINERGDLMGRVHRRRSGARAVCRTTRPAAPGSVARG